MAALGVDVLIEIFGHILPTRAGPMRLVSREWRDAADWRWPRQLMRYLAVARGVRGRENRVSYCMSSDHGALKAVIPTDSYFATLKYVYFGWGTIREVQHVGGGDRWAAEMNGRVWANLIEGRVVDDDDDIPELIEDTVEAYPPDALG